MGQETPKKWRFIPEFTVRCSSLPTECLAALDDEKLFSAVDDFLRAYSEFADTAKRLLGRFSVYEKEFGGARGYRKIAKACRSPLFLTEDQQFLASLRKLLKVPNLQSDPEVSRLLSILEQLILVNRRTIVQAETSYRQSQDRLKTIVGREEFRRSVHPHPFRLAGHSMLSEDPLSSFTNERLEPRDVWILLKLVLRMIGRNDCTRALGKLISGRVGNVSTLSFSPGKDERYCILLDRDFVQRMLLRLKFAGAQLNLHVDCVPHTTDFFRIISTALNAKARENRYFQSVGTHFCKSYELCIKYETSTDLQIKRETFDGLLIELLHLDSMLGSHVVFPYGMLKRIAPIFTKVQCMLLHRDTQISGKRYRGFGSAFHGLQLYAHKFVWTHFGAHETWQELTQFSLAKWIFGLCWLSGRVEVAPEIAQHVEDALNLAMNLIESFSELALSKFSELARSGIGFDRAFESAVRHALDGASVQGARNPQAIYNVSDIMLSGTPKEFDEGNYEIIVSDLNVRGSLLYDGQAGDAIPTMLARHLASFFHNQKDIDWAYGGLAPSGITQPAIWSIKKSLAGNGKTLHVKSIRSIGETLRSFLMRRLYPLSSRAYRFRSLRPKGLWYLLDEEYRLPAENLALGLNGNLSVRFWDSYFFLYALASKHEILERLLSKIQFSENERPRMSFRRHDHILIEEMLSCFRPIEKGLTAPRLVRSLLMIRALKARHNFSSYIYVRGMGKPILISLNSVSCVLLMRNLLTNWKKTGLKTVEISNMDPPPEKLWLRNAAGSHTAEFRFLMIRQT